jgi:SAM-dependent methyltransferase
VTQIKSEESFETLRNWLEMPLGGALLQQESRMVEEVFDCIFGEQCLQLGLWGEANVFLRFARTQQSACIADIGNIGKKRGAVTRPSAVGHLYRLPIASDSVDVVLLPHTLDYVVRSHAILREVYRVLRSDGQLVVLGFKPGGLWGLMRLIPGARLPPGVDRFISERRLNDWLQLLNFKIHGSTRYFFRWPLTGNRGSASLLWERRGQRWWPELGACYMLTAQKRIYTLTTMKKPWRSRPKVVVGLVKHTTRMSRIRFDRNS